MNFLLGKKGVVHGVHKIVTLDILLLCHKVTFKPPAVVEGQGCFTKMAITTNYTACSVNDSDKLGRPGRQVLLLNKLLTVGHTTCSVKGVLMSHTMSSC